MAPCLVVSTTAFDDDFIGRKADDLRLAALAMAFAVSVIGPLAAAGETHISANYYLIYRS